MTDRELLEFAAKAAGMPAGASAFVMLSNGDGPLQRWNPLTDDGDALRLAVKLHLSLLLPMRGGNYPAVGAGQVGSMNAACMEPHDPDPYAATRRAIVRAAAEMADQPAKFTPQEMFAPGAEGCFQDAEGTKPVTAIGQRVGRVDETRPGGVVSVLFRADLLENMPTFAPKPKVEK